MFFQYQVLLKKVARSFYLTLLFLPAQLREPIALAYLLARASDTIADKNYFSPSEKKALLELLRTISHGSQKIDETSMALLGSFHDELLQVLAELLRTLSSLKEKEAILSVWGKILKGQQLDLNFFTDSSELKMKVFSPEDRDRYMYLVAGSVGEFWTILSHAAALDSKKLFAREPLRIMLQWGIAYGKGLQLTNILRDRTEDAAQGRFYFRESEYSLLHQQAIDYLEQGRLYVAALDSKRLRYASSLPLLLAEATLAKLQQQTTGAQRVKISRWRVYSILCRGLLYAFRGNRSAERASSL